MSMGAIMGGFMGAKMQARKDCLKALKRANAISPETAITIEELGLKQCFFNLENLESTFEYLVNKKRVAQVGSKFYLNTVK